MSLTSLGLVAAFGAGILSSFLGGVILILMGMLILTGQMSQLVNLLFPFSVSP